MLGKQRKGNRNSWRFRQGRAFYSEIWLEFRGREESRELMQENSDFVFCLKGATQGLIPLRAPISQNPDWLPFLFSFLYLFQPFFWRVDVERAEGGGIQSKQPFSAALCPGDWADRNQGALQTVTGGVLLKKCSVEQRHRQWEELVAAIG